MKTSPYSISFQPLLECQSAEHARLSLCTNDIVRVDLAHRLVTVNSTPLHHLRYHDVVVFHVLAQEASKEDASPVTTTDLVSRIEDGTKSRLYGWLNVTPAAVHRAVCRLRSVLKVNRLNPNLVEPMPGRLGYRLSTPFPNVVMVAREDEPPRGENRGRIAREAASLQRSPGETGAGERQTG